MTRNPLNMTEELEAAALWTDKHKRRMVSEMTSTGWNILSRAVFHLEARLKAALSASDR